MKVLGFPEREKGRLVESSGNTEQNGVFLLHKADTEVGHSGGPVFDGANGADQQVIALHVAGYDPDYNRALLLRQDLQDFVNSTMVQWS